MRTQGATLVAAALVLIGAAPASAVTGGFGVAKALQAGPLPIFVAPTKRVDKVTACHSSGPKSQTTAKSVGVAEQLTRKFGPVACEQPPRGQLPDTLKHAVAAAMAVLG